MRSLLLLLFIISALGGSERIVSLSPSITEILYALGEGEAIVATSSYSLHPKEAQEIPRIGGISSPNIEKVLSFNPSLVLGQEFHTQTLQQLQSLNITSLSLCLQRVRSIQNSIKLLGKKLHKTQRAKELIDAIEDAINKAHTSTKVQKVMLVYGLHEDLSKGIYIAGHEIFFEDIIEICGHTNAYTSTLTNQPVLSYENVIALNPDQIIILHSPASNPNVNKQKALQSWYELPTNASKNKKITVLEESYLHIPSHRIAQSIDKLCKVMNH